MLFVVFRPVDNEPTSADSWVDSEPRLLLVALRLVDSDPTLLLVAFKPVDSEPTLLLVVFKPVDNEPTSTDS
ncbi:hypothetical protein WJ70_18330 [Burkholderia ubonensis]|nr:hypothetical protein WJ70_18330 [Burkholderia ubonensis]